MGGENIYKRPGAVMQNRTEINNTESALQAGLNNAQIAIEMGSSLSRLVFKDADGTYRKTALVDEIEDEAQDRSAAINALLTQLGDYALSNHTHSQYAAINHGHSWSDISGAPSIGSGEYVQKSGDEMSGALVISLSGDVALDARDVSENSDSGADNTFNLELCGSAIAGRSIKQAGVLASSRYYRAVHAESVSGYGVFGKSNSSDGVHGESSTGYGVSGSSACFPYIVLTGGNSNRCQWKLFVDSGGNLLAQRIDPDTGEGTGDVTEIA